MVSEEMKALNQVQKDQASQGGMAFSGEVDFKIVRATIESSASMQPTEPGVTFTPDNLDGIEVEISTPLEIASDDILVYMHGGGFICGNAHTSRGYASQLAAEAKMRVYSLTYRLAPENPWPAGAEDCFTFYKALLKKHPGKKIFLLGESGGANLLVVTTLMAKDAGIPLPTGIIPFSGPFDFTGKIDRTKYVGRDFTVGPDLDTIIRDNYFFDNDPINPYISPLYGNIEGFPPMMISVSSSETLCDDSRLLAEKARKAGVEVEYHETDGCFHAFQIAAKGTPESYQILKDTVQFIRKHL